MMNGHDDRDYEDQKPMISNIQYSLLFDCIKRCFKDIQMELNET
jgi:hypothetical protein